MKKAGPLSKIHLPVSWLAATMLACNTSSVAQVAGNSLLLDGMSSYVTVPDFSVLDFIDSLSIEAWINPGQTVNHTIVSKGWCNNADYAYYLEFTNGKIQFMWNTTGGCGSGNNIYRSDSVIITPYTCVHIALTYSPAGAAIYLNGSQVPGTQIQGGVGAIHDSSDPMLIGAYKSISGTFSSFVDGEIDELRLWNYALSPAEINARMNTALSGNEQGLVAYYDMEEPGTGAGFTLLNQCVWTMTLLNGVTTGTNSSPSHIPVCTLVGIDQKSLTTSRPEIYPNPNAGRFKLVVGSTSPGSPVFVEIRNTLFQVVYEGVVFQDETEIILDPKVRSGIYFLALRNDKHEMAGQARFVIR